MSIEIRNLTHIYSPNTAYEKIAVDNVNIKIDKGEFVGLIGHTGSGKSTLIQHLNALIKPTSGDILINGESIFKDKASMLKSRQKVGLVFQYPEHQLFEMTIYKDVAYGPTNLKLPQEEIDKRVKKALSIVGISEEYYEISPFSLSGGQKRRVAIAGIIAMEPEVLILDEPTAGLDPKGRDEILLEIKKLHEKLGITVILVSHSMEDVAEFASRVIVMNDGKISLDGTPKEVFKEIETLQKIGLSSPQISFVFKELRDKGFDVPQDIFTTCEATSFLYKFLTDDKDI